MKLVQCALEGKASDLEAAIACSCPSLENERVRKKYKKEHMRTISQLRDLQRSHRSGKATKAKQRKVDLLSLFGGRQSNVLFFPGRF